MTTLAADMLARVGPAILRLDLHPPKSCETITCDAPPILPRLGMLDRDRSRDADAAVYECVCGWTRTERLR